ncbi:hypothetical protein G9A89_015172 [Geosiphon pyriformis]|nr:hypothetical protein G9A89_015172 [Geosiphon pyriformis]
MSREAELQKRKSKLQIAGLTCANCRKTSEEAGVMALSRCARCRMLYYCSKSCQKADFSDHKMFCKAVHDLWELKEWDPCEGDESKWNKRVVDQITCLGLDLDRPLDNYERNFILYQPKCQVCFVTPMELEKPPKMIPCSECKIILCCSNQHWEIHRSRHQSHCSTYKIMIECENIIYDMVDGIEGTAWAQEEWDENKKFPPLPKDWQSYFEWRNAPMFSDSFAKIVTNSLSQPLTILAALEKFYTRDQINSFDELIIHIIGAGQYEIMSLMAFEELMHVLPNIRILSLALIGFELPNISSRISMGCCPRCTKAKRKRISSIHPTSYHQYAESLDYCAPHLAVGFNTGLYEDDTQHWEPTVRSLLQKNIPCVFTSYSKEEAKQDLQTLKDWGAKIIIGNKENKWRSTVPIVEPQILDRFFYNNYYRTLFRGKK